MRANKHARLEISEVRCHEQGAPYQTEAKIVLVLGQPGRGKHPVRIPVDFVEPPMNLGQMEKNYYMFQRAIEENN